MSGDTSGVLQLASNNGTTAVTIDTSQNVGIGTTSPTNRFNVKGASGAGEARLDGNSGGAVYTSNGDVQLYTNNSAYSVRFLTATGAAESARFDNSGNLGIGTSSPNGRLHLNTSASSIAITLQASGAYAYLYNDGTYVGLASDIGSTGVKFRVARAAPDNAVTIDSSGNLLVGTTSGSGNGEKFNVTGSVVGYLTRSYNSSANPYGYYYNYSAASPNNTSNEFIRFDDSTATRATVRSNGGIANYSGNNVNLSDRREKTNFAPAKAYLDIVCNIPVQTFNYIDQNKEQDDGLTLGVVAQDVQAVAPELVSESNWGTEEKPKMRLSIYQTDLQYALMKSIQELKAINDTQAETLTQQTEAINALTARIVALEAK
jgi:hypothetical protein